MIMSKYEEFEEVVAGVENDLRMDDMNIMEKALRMPAIKHFWIGKYIRAKIELKRMEKEKVELMKTLESSDKFNEINLSKESLRRKFMSSPKMQEIVERIDELNMIIEYLNDAKFVLGRATDDIKNFIELRKLEQM